MATQTVDSHQTTTSDEQMDKFSEALKVTEQINLSSPHETVEDDREKGQGDSLHISDSTLSTSKKKEVDFQVEPSDIEVKKTDETPVLNLPVHDNVKLENETTSVAEVSTATSSNETLHEERSSNEPVGGEATELPVIAFLEKSIKEFDANDNGKSPPEEQPTAEVIQKETLEVPAATSAQKVEEQPSEIVGLPKLQDESSSVIVNCEEKEKWGAGIHFVTDVAEKVETVSVSVEKVEEKKPKIIANTESSVMADSGKGPADAEEERATECISVEKEPDKEPGNDVPEEPVDPPKKEGQPIKVVPMEEIIVVAAKEIIGTVEPPTEKEQPVDVHSFKRLEEVIAKEISIPTEVPKEKEQESEVEAGQESREVIERKISESVEVSHENEFLVEVHPAKEKVMIEKETNESIEPPKNKEQPDEVISQKESVEFITEEVSASFRPPKNKEQADEGFSGTNSDEVKQKEANDSTLGSEEVEKQEKEANEVKDGIGELPEITKHVQDTYVEAETVIDEKTLAPGDDTSPPIEGKIKEEDGSHKQDSVCQMTESGPTQDSVKGSEKEKPATEFVTVEKEPRLEPETTCALEESVEPTQKDARPIEAVPVKEQVEVFAKEVIETVEPPTEKNQPVVVAKEISEVVTKEVTEKVEPSTEKEQSVVIAKEMSEVVAKEVIETFEPPTEKEQPVVAAKETSESIEPLKNKKQPDEVNSQKESVEVIAQEVSASFDPPNNNLQADEGIPMTKSGKRLEEEHPAKEFVSVNKESREESETTPVSDIFVEPPRKEVQSIEVLTVEEQVEVIMKEIIVTIEPPTEKEHPIEVQAEEQEQAAEVQSVQESTEVKGEKISESVEIPKESELLIEVQIVKELEVVAEDTSESIKPSKNKEQQNEAPCEKESEVIAREIRESFVPSKDIVQANEGFPVTESEEVGAKEASGSKSGPEEIEKQEPEVTKARDCKEELPEITNQVQNDYVVVETEPIVKGENVKEQKSLALGDDNTPPLRLGQIHKEEEQCTMESNKQDSVDQSAQTSEELAAPDFSTRDVKEDEKKESSNIDVVAQLSEVEALAVEKVGEENEEKAVKTEKAYQDKYEKIQELTSPREEVAPRDYETDPVVAGKSIDDQKVGELVDLIAETKIEKSITDEKLAPVEPGNVNETPKEPRVSELEVKDEQIVRTKGEVTKLNDKKEVPSKPSHKHSHNILSKVKQSLVKAKKAIIGKSPSSKTLSSQARDDIKVK